MRAIFAFFFLLLSVVASFSEESKADYIKRVREHVDAVRYDRIVVQAAARPSSDPKIATVTFRINADGSITNVKVVKGNVSAELGRFITQAFANLPRVKNVPKSIGTSQFQVKLEIGV